MTDLDLDVTVTRTALGLPALPINDHVTYYLSPAFLGGSVVWSRSQATSPFLDGAVTTYRNRQLVTEQIGVEVLADHQAALKLAVDALISAFCQDRFTLTVTITDPATDDAPTVATYGYACEAADYTLTWTGPRFMATQAQVTLAVPRQPVALSGVA